MNNQTTPDFTGFFRTSDANSRPDFCSIDAALKLGRVQPHEDAECLHHHKHGKLPYSAAIAMGLIDKEAAKTIKAHTNVLRAPRAFILPTEATIAGGPMGPHEGTPAGAVAAALQKFVSTRSDEDAAGFAKALEVALAASK